jgi:hypothetical protein
VSYQKPSELTGQVPFLAALATVRGWAADLYDQCWRIDDPKAPRGFEDDDVKLLLAVRLKTLAMAEIRLGRSSIRDGDDYNHWYSACWPREFRWKLTTQ